MKYFKKIIGKRLFLSPISLDDADQYVEWLNNLEISINLGNPSKTYTLEREKELLKEISDNGHTFGIVDCKRDRLIGNIGLMKVDMRNRKAELGIFIGDKSYWNKGYGGESIQLILDYAFNLLNLNSVYLRVHEFNKRGIKCYKKIGFKESGRQRESYIIGSTKYDDIYMDILASEFEGKIPELLEKS